MSCYSLAEKITPVRADFLVELRGFEPLTSALRGTRGLDGSTASVLEGLGVESAPLDPAYNGAASLPLRAPSAWKVSPVSTRTAGSPVAASQRRMITST